MAINSHIMRHFIWGILKTIVGLPMCQMSFRCAGVNETYSSIFRVGGFYSCLPLLHMHIKISSLLLKSQARKKKRNIFLTTKKKRYVSFFDLHCSSK